ncbi:hypothetical protein PHYBLDRAFT_173770 [Phycomyces blakesleeanus NRRL 1555(-)]|uniref:Uncharacterized protein n=1 Tax=Phycomyces blakesleeanus (strain ATCC 8743b / DSM 1359 / FGSC 10004 / NBRC 33097 / NRRL 1555) TaxID=763407 RepID=A0A162N2M5_PHYB8|nr:hypothetical protein PHYBLDRAFT_173770 [Phycomyces blakesleeanus NRRL 1555(-)]OAD67858.1 hypothetical protein PHYBLDRAFT_173770 [Phycomyces blakesleeanus NRRL 1555(-)]|eukprot:XP_018285898.1 hypothetical protein PHYBLDRAFT_173770 [Phycomyces blakesleeanus NRRL 1555(-)]
MDPKACYEYSLGHNPIPMTLLPGQHLSACRCPTQNSLLSNHYVRLVEVDGDYLPAAPILDTSFWPEGLEKDTGPRLCVSLFLIIESGYKKLLNIKLSQDTKDYVNLTHQSECSKRTRNDRQDMSLVFVFKFYRNIVKRRSFDLFNLIVFINVITGDFQVKGINIQSIFALILLLCFHLAITKCCLNIRVADF